LRYRWRMRSLLCRLLKDQSAATMVEYGLVVAGVSLAIVAGLGAVSGNMRDTFMTLANFMQNAGK
jgi:pilus assembly protein Flp/PilA